MQNSLFPVPLVVVHPPPVLAEVLVSLDVELHKVTDLDGVNLTSATVADLVHGLPQDVLVLFFVDVFALVVRLDGQFHLLDGPLLCVQFLQVLIRVFSLTVPTSFTRSSCPSR